MLDRLRLNAQLAVDELFEQKRIPLKLAVKEVEILGAADFPDIQDRVLFRRIGFVLG